MIGKISDVIYKSKMKFLENIYIVCLLKYIIIQFYVFGKRNNMVQAYFYAIKTENLNKKLRHGNLVSKISQEPLWYRFCGNVKTFHLTQHLLWAVLLYVTQKFELSST